MFITIDCKKQAFTQKRVKRMYETLQLIQRGLNNNHIKDVSLLVHVEGAKSLPVVTLSSIVDRSLKP